MDVLERFFQRDQPFSDDRRVSPFRAAVERPSELPSDRPAPSKSDAGAEPPEASRTEAAEQSDNPNDLSPEEELVVADLQVRDAEVRAHENAHAAVGGQYAGSPTYEFTTGPDGKPKVFKKATVHNFYEFFETFKQRNIFKDEQLAELVDRAKAILCGYSAKTIRSNSQLKEHIKNGMSEVENAMAEILSRPRRKIIMN